MQSMKNRNSEQTPLRLTEGADTPLAKLSLPRLARGITRPRLFRILDEARQKAAVWIVAPGGAGKTTLAATYLQERKQPFLWYQLDKDDTDPATFFYYLGIAAKQASPGQDIPLPLLTPEYLPDIPGFARRYFRDLCTRLQPGTVLVLDNYQNLGESAIFTEILRSAIGEIPEGTNILVVSRADPPSELARHRATGALEIVDWDALRLTLDEAQAIASHSQMLDENVIHALYQRSEGWAAGLTLLLEQIKRKGIDDWSVGAGSLEVVFNFFASEFFNDLPEATRDFLLKTALLSHMTPTFAERMSGNHNAGKILTDLHRRHFFINRRDLVETSYQYHDLFREFLLARSREIYTPEQYLELVRLASRLLNERGRQEEAVALHLQAEDWEAATPLLLAQAPQLFAQGRTQIVAGWIQKMPEQLVNSVPWLLYWKGMSQQFVDPLAARATLEQSYAGFVAANDVMGEMLAASSIIDIVYILRQGLISEFPRIEKLQYQLAKHPVFPSLALEVKILTSLVSQLMFGRPQDPQLPRYAERLTTLLDSEMDINQKIFAAGHLLYYYGLIGGNLEECDRILKQISPLANSPRLTAVNQIFWRHMCLAPYLLSGRVDAAYENIHPVSVLVKDNNLQFMEFIASLYDVIVYLNAGNTKAAEPLLDRMEILLNASQPLDVAWHYFAKFLHALTIGERDLILSYGQSSLQAHSKLGMVSIAMEINCLLAVACCENGKPEEVSDYLTMPRDNGFGGSPFIQHQVLLVEAYSALLLGNNENCHDRLRNAFIIADKQAFFGNFFCWYPKRMMSKLCAEALRAGIEVEYVRQLILNNGLLPENTGIEKWPWPVRIYTLGQFKVVINENPIAETKAQRRPINLLMVLIALGGSDVKAERIMEVLWPEAEGDAAVSAFTTTLSRLRKLIGNEAITVKDGRVSLDERRCWVDVWALEHHLDRAHQEDADPPAIHATAERVLDLYRGPFLSDEEGGWSRRLRSRLQTKLFRCLSQCCRALQEGGDGDQAVLLLERALEINPGIEDIYRDLMAGYAAMGRDAEALTTYARCQDTLPRDYGITPSQEIEMLYRNIKESHSS